MKLLSFVFILFIALKSYAYCDKPTFNIYFANGMFNSHRAAAKSYMALKNIYENQEFEGVSIKFDESFVAYNTNEDLLTQLFEVARQKSTDVDFKFWKYLSNMDASPEWFRELAANLQKETVLSEVFKNQDIRVQIKSYTKLLQDPKNHILTIAHSQGNFFTNFAFSALDINHEYSQRLNMVSVATPAGFVFNHGSYINLKSDCVVAHMPGALAFNVANENTGDCDHSFVENYLLNGSNSLKKIKSSIEFSLITTTENEPGEVSVSADIKQFMFWQQRLEKSDYDKKFEPHQCFAFRLVYSLRNTYWQNVDCQRRGLLGMRDAGLQCLNLKHNKKVKENLCPNFYGKISQNFLDQTGYLFHEGNLPNFYDKQTECNWTKDQFLSEVLTDDLNYKTQKFLSDPWHEIDLN